MMPEILFNQAYFVSGAALEFSPQTLRLQVFAVAIAR
jgi:hypothetical protein